MEHWAKFSVYLRGPEGRYWAFPLFAILPVLNLLSFVSNMTRRTPVPTFDGETSSIASYERLFLLLNQISPIEPSKRAANLMLRMNFMARQVCMAIRKGCIEQDYGVHRLLRILRGRFAPEAVAALYRGVTKF